jgi:Zn-dependent peptidase ImmA (M78 family)
MRDIVENEANIFAAHLLIDERKLLAILKYGWSVFEASQILGINVNLIYIKLAEMNRWGYNFDLSWGDRNLFG